MYDPHGTEGTEPADVKRLGNAFCHAKLLLTASELGLFAHLAEHPPATGPELGAALGIHPRACRDFLDALTLLGLLVREGDRYRNSPAAERCLVPGRPGHIGGFLNRADKVLYPAWGRLPDAVRTGRPQVPEARDGAFEQMLTDPERLGNYLRMMDAVNGLIAPLLATAFPWAGHSDVVDVGGARGNVAAHLLAAHPHLRATVFDLPPMEAPFDALLTERGVRDRARFTAGDFRTEDLPGGDVLIIGHVLHNWGEEDRRLIVKKAYDAVRPGGALLVYDAMLDEHPTDLARVLVSLNMLLMTEHGAEYLADDCREWLSDAGFTGVDAVPLGPADTLVIGRKS